MSGTSSPGGAGVPPQLDTSEAHSARVWNYLLGGKDNFAADRAAGDLVLKTFPGIAHVARVQRRFLARAVRYLAAEAGITQFLDIGTGLPTANNTHQIAQQIAPHSRIVYVDNDPMSRVAYGVTPVTWGTEAAARRDPGGDVRAGGAYAHARRDYECPALGGTKDSRQDDRPAGTEHQPAFVSSLAGATGEVLAVIAELCDRVAIMRAGQVVEQGPTGLVIAAPRHDYTRELLAAVPRLSGEDETLIPPGTPPQGLGE